MQNVSTLSCKNSLFKLFILCAAHCISGFRSSTEYVLVIFKPSATGTLPLSTQRGSFMVWEINMGVCPRLEFDNIMFINCLGYDFYIYGAFEFLCNSIANL